MNAGLFGEKLLGHFSLCCHVDSNDICLEMARRCKPQCGLRGSSGGTSKFIFTNGISFNYNPHRFALQFQLIKATIYRLSLDPRIAERRARAEIKKVKYLLSCFRFVSKNWLNTITQSAAWQTPISRLRREIHKFTQSPRMKSLHNTILFIISTWVSIMRPNIKAIPCAMMALVRQNYGHHYNAVNNNHHPGVV